jgi:uncharacterized membrane protein
MDAHLSLEAAAVRFDAAMARLEAGLSGAVSKVADMARRAGYEEGFADGAATRPGEAAPMLETGGEDAPILREALAAARTREIALQAAVEEAKAALDDAIDDIRAALGPV